MSETHVTIRNFAVPKQVYARLSEISEYRGVPLTRLIRWICENWVNTGSPMIEERIALQIEDDRKILGISAEKLIVTIVKDWYSRHSIADLISQERSQGEKETRNNIDRLWENLLIQQSKNPRGKGGLQ